MTIFDFKAQIKEVQIPILHTVEEVMNLIIETAKDKSAYKVEFWWKQERMNYCKPNWGTITPFDYNKTFFEELRNEFNQGSTGFVLNIPSNSYIIPLNIQFRNLTYWVYYKNDIPIWFSNVASATDTPSHLSSFKDSDIPEDWDRFEKASF